MQAVILTQFGSPDVLKLREVARPIPKDNEILIKVRAASVNYGDLIARRFNTVSPREFNMPSFFWLPARISFGLRKPSIQILGSEIAGEVEAVGKDVTHFKPGDSVVGYPGQGFGGYAEYVCMAETAMVAPKPSTMSYEEAAAYPYGALTALNLLKKANIQPGQKVLILGASGGIGSAAVQLAKHYGAEVTGVCSTPRMAYVKALGADKVIDYTREDFTQSGETYDVVLDVLGRGSYARIKGSLTKNGRYLLASFKIKQLFQMLWTSRFSSQKVICALSMESREDLLHLNELAEAGIMRSPVERCYPLAQAAEAHRYSESGQAQGRVVITVA